jgi:hypothetical protein
MAMRTKWRKVSLVHPRRSPFTPGRWSSSFGFRPPNLVQNVRCLLDTLSRTGPHLTHCKQTIGACATRHTKKVMTHAIVGEKSSRKIGRKYPLMLPASGPASRLPDAKAQNNTFALCSPCATMLLQKCRGRAIRTLVESGRPLRRDLNESPRGGTYERRKV